MANCSSNSSAVLDVVTVNKELASLKDASEININNSTASSNYDRSIAKSPGVESFSSIQDIDNLAELNVDGNSDISVKIDNPQKHLETLETYISFRITTKVVKIEFPENEYVVYRRYNDFLWLKQQLMECHPFCIVPPLPGKHSLIGQLDRYSKDFILQRMHALNKFVSRICQHPILSCNNHFKIFLTAKHADFTLHRKQRYPIEYKVFSLRHPNSTARSLNSFNEEFDKTKTYLNTLSDKLNSFERISNRINKERIDYANELHNYHPVFLSWSRSEPDFADLLQMISVALERNAATQNLMVQSCVNVKDNPVKDLLAYIEVVQETIKKRESYQCLYESSLEELNKRHADKHKLLAVTQNPSQSSSAGFSLWKPNNPEEKLEKLSSYIPQLMKKVETHQDKLECANECLRSDLERWQIEKRQHLEKILLDFVNKQVNYYTTSLNAWASVANYLNQQRDNSHRNGSE